ncbi:hypothetical protein HPP92_006167 [Vanilla planifolia]|uniref:SHSP domain-containing protein n=1 Tax=Vanilla planifolia TaxID=51239 RepID=A0A835VFE5_VANPL|nr:hypothetical protein HPP92_006167 [Vanilla planifolia]
MKGRSEPGWPSCDEFQPSSEWVEDSSNYILLIQLPGFKKDDISIIVDTAGKLTVGVSKQRNGVKSAPFEQSFSAPPNSNIEEASAKFENGCLALFIPKAESSAASSADTKSKPTFEEMQGLVMEIKDLVQTEAARLSKEREEEEWEKGKEPSGEKWQGRGEERGSWKRRSGWDGKEWCDRGFFELIQNAGGEGKMFMVAMVAFSVGLIVCCKMRRGGS